MLATSILAPAKNSAETIAKSRPRRDKVASLFGSSQMIRI